MIELAPTDLDPVRLAADHSPMVRPWKRAAIYMEPLLPNPRFAGMSVEEAADAMGMSPATLKRRWALARAWLFRELSQ